LLRRETSAAPARFRKVKFTEFCEDSSLRNRKIALAMLFVFL